MHVESPVLEGWGNEGDPETYTPDLLHMASHLSPWDRPAGYESACGPANSSPQQLQDDPQESGWYHGTQNDNSAFTSPPQFGGAGFHQLNIDQKLQTMDNQRVLYRSSPHGAVQRLVGGRSRVALEALLAEADSQRRYPNIERAGPHKRELEDAPPVRREWVARPLSATMRARLKGKPAVASHNTDAHLALEQRRQRLEQRRQEEVTTRREAAGELRIVSRGRGGFAEGIYVPGRDGPAPLHRKGLMGIQPLLPNHAKNGVALSPPKMSGSVSSKTLNIRLQVPAKMTVRREAPSAKLRVKKSRSVPNSLAQRPGKKKASKRAQTRSSRRRRPHSAAATTSRMRQGNRTRHEHPGGSRIQRSATVPTLRCARATLS